jgi:hypothetical protein
MPLFEPPPNNLPLPTLIAGNNGAANGAAAPSETWQFLTTNAAANSTSGFVVFMTTTGLAVGTYFFEYFLVWQTVATTTGINFNVDFGSGSTSRFRNTRHLQTTGTLAASGVADGVATTNTGQLVEHYSARAIGNSLGSSAGVDTINADQLNHICGAFVVSSGPATMLIYSASEVNGSSTQVMADSTLLLKRVA